MRVEVDLEFNGLLLVITCPLQHFLKFRTCATLQFESVS